MDLIKIVNDYEKALNRLESAFSKATEFRNRELYEFFRDSTIQRFEFSVELMWKLIKRFLEEHEGISCRSPKSCIREFLSAGYLSQDETLTLLRMIDDRNRTSHTYHEEVAEEIFEKIGLYLPLLKKVKEIILKSI